MIRRFVVAVVMLTIFTACGGTAATTENATSAAAYDAGAGATTADGLAPAAGQEAPAAPIAEGGEGTTSNTSNPNTEAQFGRMVIRTANLSLLVESADEAEAKVRNLVQSVGGYVLSSETSGDEESRNVQLTFKVPVAQFDRTLDSVAQFAVKVQSRSVTGEDVTDQFVDTEARLRTLRATEARLLEFLAAARNTEEALQVNEQLTMLQGEIEQASGRLEMLKQSTAFSTITVDLQPNILLALDTNASWSPMVVARQSWQNLVVFMQGVADIAIALAVWTPVWAILGLVAFIVWRRWGRSTTPQQPTPPQPTTTQPTS
jgi:hypothetical protein